MNFGSPGTKDFLFISGLWWIPRRKKEDCRRTEKNITRKKGSKNVENCLGPLIVVIVLKILI